MLKNVNCVFSNQCNIIGGEVWRWQEKCVEVAIEVCGGGRSVWRWQEKCVEVAEVCAGGRSVEVAEEVCGGGGRSVWRWREKHMKLAEVCEGGRSVWRWQKYVEVAVVEWRWREKRVEVAGEACGGGGRSVWRWREKRVEVVGEACGGGNFYMENCMDQMLGRSRTSDGIKVTLIHTSFHSSCITHRERVIERREIQICKRVEEKNYMHEKSTAMVHK